MAFKLFPLNSVCATTEQLAGRFREIITAKIIILFKCSNPRYLRIITAVCTLSATPPLTSTTGSVLRAILDSQKNDDSKRFQ